MAKYKQHGRTSCLEHCLVVSYYSYLLAHHFNLQVDDYSLIRGSLLHDFFLYDWHDSSAHPRFHGFKHPVIALENANHLFHLSDIEKDIIRHHMWPLTLVPPHTLEGLIVCLIDKWCSLKETFFLTSEIPALRDYLHYYCIDY